MKYNAECYMSKKKILHMGEPRIKFNQIETNILSILDDTTEFKCWMNNNFIQLIISEDSMWGAFLFDNDIIKDCPWLSSAQLDRSLVQDDITKFIKNMIDNNVYIWMNIEVKDIPAYGENMSFHDIFIYGYDENEEKMYVADFIHGGHYQRFLLSYRQICTAYQGMNRYRDPLGIYLIWKKKNICPYLNQYTESTKMIREGLKGFLSAKYPFSILKFMEKESQFKNSFWGIGIYKGLIKYCTTLQSKATDYPKYKIFDLLYKHKVIMSERIEYIEASYGIKNLESEKELGKLLEKKSLVIRNMFLKYYVSRKMALLESIKKMLVEMESWDRILCKNLLEKI